MPDPEPANGGTVPTAAPVAVVIVTFDSPPRLLEQCVERVLATVDHAETTVVVVDTGGAATRRLDDLVRDGAIEVLDLGVNAGFAAALTAGFEHAGGAEVFVSLNDDVLVEPGWLEPLRDALASDPELGAVQPLLVQLGSDPESVNSAGVQIDRYGAGSDRLRGEPVESAVAAGMTMLDGVTGGAAAWSARFVESVGWPDPRYFLYYEDVDWCRRGTRAGWRFALVPASRVLHVGSASTNRLGGTLLRLQERNRLWCVASHGRPSELVRALGLSARRLRHEPRAVHRAAMIDGIRGMPRRLLERRRSGASSAPESEPDGPPAFVRRPVTGVNVLGYHHISSGLGDIARSITQSLRAAGIDVIEIDNDLSASPRRRPARPIPSALHHTTIAVVTAFEFEGLVARLPELRADGRRLIGYWFWELTTIPDAHVRAMDVLDEVWCASRFVSDAYRTVAPGWVPVRRVQSQLPRPTADVRAAATWRNRWGGDVVFLVTFDYLSIPERKNPVAAVRAFLDAFDVGDGALLVIKSMNGAQRPDAVARLAVEIGDRPDVLVVDEHLDEVAHHALIAAVDVLVSPHRSEGLGLQPFAAMALGTAVIATRYSGVLDYLDDTNSILVDHRSVGVVDGEGIYPVGAPWADIDHDGLVAAMRSVYDDADLRRDLISAGRATAAAWPDDAALGAAYAELLATAEPRTTDLDHILLPAHRAPVDTTAVTKA